MKTRCVIVAGGDRPTELFQKITENDFVIAADSGLKFCLEANVRPDLIVGDFDSFFGALPKGVETVKLPTHKDDTDLLFAARCGVERGLSRFAILGGYGSRPDQNMAMFQTLCWIVEQKEDADATAICNGFEVSVIKNQRKTFKADKNRYLSVFAIDGDAEGVEGVHNLLVDSRAAGYDQSHVLTKDFHDFLGERLTDIQSQLLCCTVGF